MSSSFSYHVDDPSGFVKPINLTCETLEVSSNRNSLHNLTLEIQRSLPIELHISCIEICDSEINCSVEIYKDFQTHSKISLEKLVAETIKDKIPSNSPVNINIKTLLIGSDFDFDNLKFLRKLNIVYPEIHGVSFDNDRVAVYLSDNSRVKDIRNQFRKYFHPLNKDKSIKFVEIAEDSSNVFQNKDVTSRIFNLERRYLNDVESLCISGNESIITVNNLSLSEGEISKILGKLNVAFENVKGGDSFAFEVQKSALHLDHVRGVINKYQDILAVKYKIISNTLYVKLLIHAAGTFQSTSSAKKGIVVLVNNLEDVYTSNVFTILPANIPFSDVKDNGNKLWVNASAPIKELEPFREEIKLRTGIDTILFSSEALVPITQTDLLLRLHSRIKSGLELMKTNYNVVTRKVLLTFLNKPTKEEFIDIKNIAGPDIEVNVLDTKDVPSSVENIAKTLRRSVPVYTIGTKRYDTLLTRNYGPCPDIGNSAIIVEMGDLKILLDCGSDFKDEENQFIDEEHFSDIDVVILSHVHTDHIGRLPYLLKKYPHIKVITTKATMMLSEYVLSQCLFHRNNLGYTTKDLQRVYNSCALVTPGFKYKLSDQITLTCLNSGHAPGSLMVKLKSSDNHELFYTGDINSRASGLLPGINIGDVRSQNVIIDSTYGTTTFPSREEIVSKFRENLTNACNGGGRVLIPSLVIGRAQEVLIELIRLEKEKGYFSSNNIKVYIDGSIGKINEIISYLHAQYPDLFNSDNSELISEIFSNDSFITYIRGRDERKNVLARNKPAVILASSGMLLGISNEYFQSLKDDERNLLLMVNYQSDDSKGRKLLENRFAYGNRMQIAQAQFSAHNRYEDTIRTLENLGAKNAYLIHAEGSKAERLEIKINDSNLSFRAKQLSPDVVEVMS